MQVQEGRKTFYSTGEKNTWKPESTACVSGRGPQQRALKDGLHTQVGPRGNKKELPRRWEFVDNGGSLELFYQGTRSSGDQMIGDTGRLT